MTHGPKPVSGEHCSWCGGPLSDTALERGLGACSAEHAAAAREHFARASRMTVVACPKPEKSSYRTQGDAIAWARYWGNAWYLCECGVYHLRGDERVRTAFGQNLRKSERLLQLRDGFAADAGREHDAGVERALADWEYACDKLLAACDAADADAFGFFRGVVSAALVRSVLLGSLRRFEADMLDTNKYGQYGAGWSDGAPMPVPRQRVLARSSETGDVCLATVSAVDAQARRAWLTVDWSAPVPPGDVPAGGSWERARPRRPSSSADGEQSSGEQSGGEQSGGGAVHRAPSDGGLRALLGG